MEIYWYWPWPHDRAAGLASAAARPGDRLVVHALDTGSAPHGARSGYTVIDDLPTPSDVRERSPRWVADRMGMLLSRERRRRAMLSSGRFDVAHIHLLNLLTDSWALGQLTPDVPLVSTVHDVRPHHQRLPDSLEERLLARMYRRAGALIVYHDYLRDQLVEHFGVEEDRVRVIPHPIRDFRPGGGGAHGTPTVLFFGTLRRNKGIHVLLRTIEQLRDGDVRFHVAGRGVVELEEQVRDAAARLPNLTADIGYISNAERERLYHDADLVVLPYTAFESQSGVLADAYSFGVPLVVTDVGALGETVRADGTGWAVRPSDARALAEQVVEALGDDAGRQAARERMERLAHERSEAATAAAFRAAYDDVV